MKVTIMQITVQLLLSIGSWHVERSRKALASIKCYDSVSYLFNRIDTLEAILKISAFRQQFQLYLLCWPVVNHRHHLPLILCTEIHPAGSSEQTTVILTDQADSGSVYYRCKILDIVD